MPDWHAVLTTIGTAVLIVLGVMALDGLSAITQAMH